MLLTIDINSMIPSYLTQSGWPAIAQGENGKLLKLRFLSSEAKPIIGEILETSGHGGIFPWCQCWKNNINVKWKLLC